MMIDGNLKLEYNNLELQISSNEKILGVHVDENLGALVWNSIPLWIKKTLVPLSHLQITA